MNDLRVLIVISLQGAANGFLPEMKDLAKATVS